MKYGFRIGMFLLASAFLMRCYDKDILESDTYNNDFTYRAEFAVPIGNINLKATDIIDTAGIGSIDTADVVDSLVYNDTLVDFIVGGYLVENPEQFDTTLSYEFSLSRFNTDISYIKELVLRLNIINELPFEITAKPAFYSMGSVLPISSIQFDKLEIPAAPINSDGKVTGSAVSWDNDSYLDSTGISGIWSVDNIKVDVTVNTNIPTALTTIEIDTGKLITIQVAARFVAEKKFDF